MPKPMRDPEYLRDSPGHNHAYALIYEGNQNQGS